MPRILSEIASFGRIYECCHCPNIHFELGPLTISLTRDAYVQLVKLVATSATNYESPRNGCSTREIDCDDREASKYRM